jgi:hypothetical protein
MKETITVGHLGNAVFLKQMCSNGIKTKKYQVLVLLDYKAPHYITFSILVLLPLS